MELMVTLAIVGVLLTIGVPSLKSFMKGNQLVASTNDLLSALHVARSEAIKLNKRVTVCTSVNGTSCASPASGNWRKGWIVFADANGDLNGTGAVCSNATTDCLLRSHDEVTDSLLSMSGLYSSGGAITSFTFTSRGLPKDSSGSSQSGTFSICSYDDSNNVTGSRAIVLSLSGRVRVTENAAAINCPASPS